MDEKPTTYTFLIAGDVTFRVALEDTGLPTKLRHAIEDVLENRGALPGSVRVESRIGVEHA